jgi:hypothetical protein
VAAAVSVDRLAGDWLQEAGLLEAQGPPDENVVAESWNWDQRVHPSQTDHDQEALNNGEGLHTMSLLELHYTARDRHCL